MPVCIEMTGVACGGIDMKLPHSLTIFVWGTLALSLIGCGQGKPVIQSSPPAQVASRPIWQDRLSGEDAYFRIVSRITNSGGLENLPDICSGNMLAKVFTTQKKSYSLLTYLDGAQAELPLLLVSAANNNSAQNPC